MKQKPKSPKGGHPFILLVDDAAPVRQRMHQILMETANNLAVVEAGSVAEANRLFDAIEPQTILLDLGLPDGDGVDVLRRAKAADPSCVVVVLTNYADPETRLHCVEMGADFVFAKSDQFELAAETVRRVLAREPLREAGAHRPRRVHLKLSNPSGLHIRPAAELVKLAQQFEAQIDIACNNRTADAKSIMAVLILGAERGAELVVTAAGRDAAKAIAAIEELADHQFHEGAEPEARGGAGQAQDRAHPGRMTTAELR